MQSKAAKLARTCSERGKNHVDRESAARRRCSDDQRHARGGAEVPRAQARGEGDRPSSEVHERGAHRRVQACQAELRGGQGLPQLDRRARPRVHAEADEDLAVQEVGQQEGARP